MLLHRRQAAAMDALLVVVLKVCSGAAGLALFVYLLCRCALDAKKRASRAGIGGQIMATALTLFSGTALDPAREVATEARRRMLAASYARRVHGARLSTARARTVRSPPGNVATEKRFALWR